MLESLKQETNLTYTENGATTLVSSTSHCVDLFATIGALRYADDNEIIIRFRRAFIENPDIAMKILFFARDVRGGLGERKVFRVILSWLCNNRPATVVKNAGFIAEFGRFDDLLSLFYTPCEAVAIEIIKNQLQKDVENAKKQKEISLLAKWLPSVNTSNAETVKLGKYIAKQLNMNEKEYRKTLARLRGYLKIIENNLRTKDYTFDYSEQPSKAMLKYSMAFMRNDNERYREFLNAVSSGEVKFNTGTLYPYEIVCKCIDKLGYDENHNLCPVVSQEMRESLNVTWGALEDFTTDENAIAVVDTSGSMYTRDVPSPASVALSLGIYLAEKNKGDFKNHFITFSEKPQLIELKGEKFVDKLQYIMSFMEIANTNIEAVFNLILNAAVKNNIKQDEMPSKLYIISDMEFDSCAENASLTNFQNAKRKFEKAGYNLPEIVFWNVQSRNRQQPVTKNEQGVALVSGCTPRLFSMVLSGEYTPEKFMLEAISNQRYEKIVA